ncbi:phage major capsid protein [Cetobacterium sp.]|uniref:phage major capsid protein n=1 Tax=Cetobacterium sp. TaxID=2071632 RepID=UPI003EE7B25A
MAKNLKALKEKYNAKLDEIDALVELGLEEQRDLTSNEDEKITALKIEAEEIKVEIETEERSLEEVEIKREEDVVMENKELEIRGMADFIRGVDSEEVRAMTAGTDGAGIIPANLDKNIIEKFEEVAPLFAMIPKFTPMAGTLDIPVEDDLGSASFVGEGTGTADSKFRLRTVQLTQKRAGSEITLSQFLINDSGIDIVSYSQDILTRRLGYALDRAMINGTLASKSIEGLVNAPEACNYAGALTIDTFIGAMASMKAVYQGGAKWIMNRGSFEAVVKLKDATGNLYVAREVIGDTIQYKLFGLEIMINDAVAENVVYLANFAHAYKGMIKKGASLSKISEDTVNRRNGTVTLVLDTYVDARIVQPEAIKVIKITAGSKASK